MIILLSEGLGLVLKVGFERYEKLWDVARPKYLWVGLIETSNKGRMAF